MQSTNEQGNDGPSQEVVMAKVLLSLCGIESDKYTETLLGGAILAIKVAYERGREKESSLGVSGMGEMPERSGTVQSGDPEAT